MIDCKYESTENDVWKSRKGFQNITHACNDFLFDICRRLCHIVSELADKVRRGVAILLHLDEQQRRC